MICLIALIVFGILSIFSVGYRPLAKEAFGCVFKTATLRKCGSGLDAKIKSGVIGRLMKISPKVAKPVHKYFTVISWIFVIFFFVSLFLSAQVVYNLIKYDNCNGPVDENGFCILTGAGGEVNAIQNGVEGTAVSCGDPLCDNGSCEKCGSECQCTKCTG